MNKVIISLLLYFKKNNSLPNKIFAFIVLLPAFVVLSNYLLYLKQYHFGFLIFLSQAGVYTMSALLYIYSLLMMGRKFDFVISSFRYFVTVLIPLIFWGIYEFSYSETEQITFLATASSDPDLMINTMNTVGPLQYIFYMSLALYEIRKHNRDVGMVYSRNETLKLKWLNSFIGLLLLLTICLCISYFFFSNEMVELIVVPTLSNIFYFYIVYQSLNNSVLFTQEQYVDFQKNFEPLKKANNEKYQNSSLDQDDIREYSEKLEVFLKSEKWYLNPDLTLPMLAERLNISVNKLSEVINRKYNQNFFDFINQYRIEYAKNCLTNSFYDKLTLEAIAEESGFGSKTAFNRAFKKVNGFTPSQYKKAPSMLLRQTI